MTRNISSYRPAIVGLCLIVACAFAPFYSAFAQKAPDGTKPLGRDYKFHERFSYRTNVFEWMVTIPNAGIEFDLSKSQYARQTVGLSAKYNWNTWHSYVPSTVFNLMDVRPEYRYYYRYKINGNSANPRPWRARYIGAYTDYAMYAFKFGPAGIQGSGFGAGLSWGYDVSRYEYRKCAVDVEFGLSLGLFVTKYDAFTHNSNGYYYESLPEKSKDWHMTPFPVISELKLAFVLRPISVDAKYVLDDPKLKQLELAKEDVAGYFMEDGSITKARFDETHESELAELKGDSQKYTREFMRYAYAEAKDAEKNAAFDIQDAKLKAKLHKYTLSMTRKAMSKFRTALAKERMEAKKAERQEKLQKAKEERQAARQAREEELQKAKAARQEARRAEMQAKAEARQAAREEKRAARQAKDKEADNE